MEEGHADVHEGGAVVRVERGGGGDGLDAGANAADGVGVRGCGLSGHPRGGHGGGGHRGSGADADHLAALEEGLDAGDGVGSVVDGWAKGSGHGGHVFGR